MWIDSMYMWCSAQCPVLLAALMCSYWTSLVKGYSMLHVD